MKAELSCKIILSLEEMEFKISKYPLPQEVQDDDKNERSKETIANRYSTLMEKLKTLASDSGRSGKNERKLYQRCCHVLIRQCKIKTA